MEAAERLVRAAAADGADLIVLPEKFNVLGPTTVLERAPRRSTARPWPGPANGGASWDRPRGRFVRRAPRRPRQARQHLRALRPRRRDPRRLPQDPHVRRDVGGKEYRESDVRGGRRRDRALRRRRRPPRPDRLLRPALPRAVPDPGPARRPRDQRAGAFTKPTGAAHWETLLRARAIENQAFVVAADQVGIHPADKESYGGSQIVDPWGDVLARARRRRGLRGRRPRPRRQDEIRRRCPAWPTASRRPTAGRRRSAV